MIDLTIIVPIIVGLIEVFKRIGLSTRFAPLMSLVLGVALFTGAQGFSFESVVIGLVAGLTSCGLYSTGKSIVQ